MCLPHKNEVYCTVYNVLTCILCSISIAFLINNVGSLFHLNCYLDQATGDSC